MGRFMKGGPGSDRHKGWSPRYTDFTFRMALLSKSERRMFRKMDVMENTWTNKCTDDPVAFSFHGGEEIGAEEWECG
jgi:hypothetical protein